MKCYITNCKNNAVVAGPAGARDDMICWDHAIGLAEDLSGKTPVEILEKSIKEKGE